VLAPDEFVPWLWRFLPRLETPDAARWLTPVEPVDRADGKLAHLDGLNLSRAWMLEGVARALPESDPRRRALLDAAHRHGDAGLAGMATTHYAGTHWLGSFAVYWATGRGLGDGGDAAKA
jgi:hypothetical protein